MKGKKRKEEGIIVAGNEKGKEVGEKGRREGENKGRQHFFKC